MNDTTSQSVASAQGTSLPKHLIVTPLLSIICLLATLASIPLIDVYIENYMFNEDNPELAFLLTCFVGLIASSGYFCAFLCFIVILITCITKGTSKAYLISIASFLIALAQIIIMSKLT